MAIAPARAKQRQSSAVKFSKDHRIAVPREVAKRLRLRAGTSFEVFTRGDAVVFIPTNRIPKDQRWFWTDEWQAGEREVEEDIRAGRVKTFRTADDLIRDLRSV